MSLQRDMNTNLSNMIFHLSQGPGFRAGYLISEGMWNKRSVDHAKLCATLLVTSVRSL